MSATKLKEQFIRTDEFNCSAPLDRAIVKSFSPYDYLTTSQNPAIQALQSGVIDLRKLGMIVPTLGISHHLKSSEGYISYDPNAYSFTVESNVDPLKNFNELVEESKYILTLEAGWDEDVAEKIDPDLFFNSTSIISKYIEEIYDHHKFIIQNPEIGALPNGSLDFEWKTQNARLLINFRIHNESLHAFYYGDLFDNKLPIKGNVPIDKVYSHLKEWMSQLQ